MRLSGIPELLLASFHLEFLSVTFLVLAAIPKELLASELVPITFERDGSLGQSVTQDTDHTQVISELVSVEFSASSEENKCLNNLKGRAAAQAGIFCVQDNTRWL